MMDHDQYRISTEHESLALCKRMLGECNVIFDVGSHNGTYLGLLYQIFAPQSSHAFEPDPATYQDLKKSAMALPNATAVNAAVANQEGSCAFHVLNQTGSSSLLPLNMASGYVAGIGLSEASQIEVRTRTLDN